MDCNEVMASATGERVYEIREALGTRRRPLSQDAFAALLTKQGGRTYYGSEFSLIEKNEKRLTLDDVAAIAALDPERRGKYWLAWGSDADETMLPLPTPSLDEIQAEPETAVDSYTTTRAKRKDKGRAG